METRGVPPSTIGRELLAKSQNRASQGNKNGRAIRIWRLLRKKSGKILSKRETSGFEILRKVTRLKKYSIPTKCYSTLEMRSESYMDMYNEGEKSSFFEPNKKKKTFSLK